MWLACGVLQNPHQPLSAETRLGPYEIGGIPPAHAVVLNWKRLLEHP
jgi:hypothetical protein